MYKECRLHKESGTTVEKLAAEVAQQARKVEKAAECNDGHKYE